MKSIPAKILNGKNLCLEISAHSAIFHVIVSSADKTGIYGRYYVKYQMVNGEKRAVDAENKHLKPKGFFPVIGIDKIRQIGKIL